MCVFYETLPRRWHEKNKQIVSWNEMPNLRGNLNRAILWFDKELFSESPAKFHSVLCCQHNCPTMNLCLTSCSSSQKIYAPWPATVCVYYSLSPHVWRSSFFSIMTVCSSVYSATCIRSRACAVMDICTLIYPVTKQCSLVFFLSEMHTLSSLVCNKHTLSCLPGFNTSTLSPLLSVRDANSHQNGLY
jgi:hypothetical protein